MILLNVDHKIETGFVPLDLHYVLHLAKAYGWKPAGSVQPPAMTPADRWAGSYYYAAATWRAEDCTRLAAALAAAWPGAWTWRNGIRDKDRPHTLVDPRGVMLHWDGNSEFDRCPFIAESPFRQANTMAALVRLRALLALGGPLQVGGQPPDAHVGHLDVRPPRGAPLALRVQMLTGIQYPDDEVLGAGQTLMLDAMFAAELVATHRATWLDAPGAMTPAVPAS